MLKSLFAVTALTILPFAAAQAGTLKDGVWTPSSACVVPGDAPTLNSKSAAAYNASAKEAQAWQGQAKAYADCMSSETKADQSAIVSSANENITKLSAQMNALNAQNTEAVEKLKKTAGK